jgi:hypothetical protein
MEMPMAQLSHLRKDDPNAGVLLLNLLGFSKHSSWRQFNNRSYVAKLITQTRYTARSITSCEAYWGRTPLLLLKAESQENLGLEFRSPELKRFSFVLFPKLLVTIFGLG